MKRVTKTRLRVDHKEGEDGTPSDHCAGFTLGVDSAQSVYSLPLLTVLVRGGRPARRGASGDRARALGVLTRVATLGLAMGNVVVAVGAATATLGWLPGG